ncbi:hypothetical protein [Sorangium sp. So ce1153]|uniref:hypothetical protein n=1 Tax=Sorangium sp. So ce1153 TaxID=3133333 RepID=UPI003F5DE0B5
MDYKKKGGEELAGNGASGVAAGARGELTQLLQLRARQLELGTDPARGFLAAEGAAGARIEQVLGRQIKRSADTAIDFVDTVLGPISLKGPIPGTGSVEGLAKAAIKYIQANTATRALFVDLTDLSAQNAAKVQNMVEAAAAGATKKVLFLR